MRETVFNLTDACTIITYEQYNYLGSAPALPTVQFLGSGQCAVGRSTALPCTAHRFQWAGFLGRSVLGSFWAVFCAVLGAIFEFFLETQLSLREITAFAFTYLF